MTFQGRLKGCSGAFQGDFEAFQEVSWTFPIEYGDFKAV